MRHAVVTHLPRLRFALFAAALSIAGQSAFAAEVLAPPQLDIYVEFNGLVGSYLDSEFDTSAGFGLHLGLVSKGNKRLRGALEAGVINLGSDEVSYATSETVAANIIISDIDPDADPKDGELVRDFRDKGSLGGFTILAKGFLEMGRIRPYAAIGPFFYNEKYTHGEVKTWNYEVAATPTSFVLIENSETVTERGIGLAVQAGSQFKLGKTTWLNFGANYYSGDQLDVAAAQLGLSKTF